MDHKATRGRPRMGLASRPSPLDLLTPHFQCSTAIGTLPKFDFNPSTAKAHRDPPNSANLDITERSSLGLLPDYMLQHSINIQSPESLEASSMIVELPSKYLKAEDTKMNNNENVNWNSLLNSDSFQQFQQTLPNVTTVEESFHRGTISASSTMSESPRECHNPFDSFHDESVNFMDTKNNLDFIDQEEKAFQEEHKFDGPSVVELPEAAALKAPMAAATADDSHCSKSDYFMMGSSRLGSLDKEDERPNFGIPLSKSPNRTPCRILKDATFIKDGAMVDQLLPSFLEVTTTEDNLESFLKVPAPAFRKPSPSRLPVPFKVPLPVNRKTNVRHSSPIKTDCAAKQETAFAFPISSDRNFMVWFGVGASEHQIVTLKNTWNRELVASLVIRGSENFVFAKTSLQQIKINLLANSSTSVKLIFNAGKIGTWSTAKFVIKPHDLGIGRALKATIHLHGFSGIPNFSFKDMPLTDNCRSLFLGQIPNDVCKLEKIAIENLGNATGFVCLRGFMDKEFTRPVDGDSVLIEPMSFVLEAGKVQEVAIRVDPSIVGDSQDVRSFIATVAVATGPENARKVLIDLMNRGTFNTGNIVLNSMLKPFNASDLTANFVGQSSDVVPVVQIAPNALHNMISAINKSSVRMYGMKTEFHVMNYEETLSETRLNSTADCGPSPTISITPSVPTIEEEVMPRSCASTLPKTGRLGSSGKKVNVTVTSSSSAGKKPVLSGEKRRRELHLETDKLIFPPVQVGKTSVGKIKIKNPLHKAVILSAKDLQPPFKLTETEFELKSKFYRSINILFTPTSKGRHEGKLELFAQEEGAVLSAILKGTAT